MSPCPWPHLASTVGPRVTVLVPLGVPGNDEQMKLKILPLTGRDERPSALSSAVPGASCSQQHGEDTRPGLRRQRRGPRGQRHGQLLARIGLQWPRPRASSPWGWARASADRGGGAAPGPRVSCGAEQDSMAKGSHKGVLSQAPGQPPVAWPLPCSRTHFPVSFTGSVARRSPGVWRPQGGAGPWGVHPLPWRSPSPSLPTPTFLLYSLPSSARCRCVSSEVGLWVSPPPLHPSGVLPVHSGPDWDQGCCKAGCAGQGSSRAMGMSEGCFA